MSSTVTNPDPETAPELAVRKRFSRAWPLRFTAAAVSGFTLYLSFAPRPLWWLAPLAFTGLALVVHGRRSRGAFGYGFVFGVAFFLPLLAWLLDFLGPDFGPWPWLGLAMALSVYLGFGGALTTVVWRLPLGPLWAALVIIALETPRTWFPFGGFPWGRVAFSQPEGAFLSLSSIGGAPLVGLAVVLTGFGLAALCLRVKESLTRRPIVVAAVLTLAPVVAGLAVWPTVGTEAQDGELTVATVQGNAPDIGLALEDRRDELRDNHLAESARLLEELKANKTKLDLLIWPETAMSLRTGDYGVDQMVRSFDVQAIIGALVRLPDGSAQNSALVWDPVTGPGQRYAKQQLVPFGEYVPARELAKLVTPFVDSVANMAPGNGANAALSVAGTKVGVVICYETAFDHPGRESVADGAELLVVPTNNAWYGPGEMSYQQLAMSRLRAVEHGRAVIVSATSGVSAILAPDGSITASTSLFTTDSLVGRVPLRQQTTLSDLLGVTREYGLLALAAAGVVGGLVLRFRTGRTIVAKATREAAG